MAIGYFCHACGRILDEEKFAPKKLMIRSADPRDPERGDLRDVFLCPADQDRFTMDGAVIVHGWIKQLDR